MTSPFRIFNKKDISGCKPPGFSKARSDLNLTIEQYDELPGDRVVEIPVIIAAVLPELQVFNFPAFGKVSYITEVFKGNFNYFEMALAVLVGIDTCIIHCLWLSKTNKMGLGMFGCFTQRRKGAKKSRLQEAINRILFVKLNTTLKS